MFRRATSLAAACAVVAGLVSGCQGPGCTAANAYEAYAPFVLAVLPEVAPETIPGIAVDLGLFAVDALARYLIDHTVRSGKTWLLIEQTLNGQQKTSVFELNTDHELKVSVNGAQLKHVDIYVKKQQIKVVIPPGTTAKIAVTDAQGSESVKVRGTVPGDLGGSQDLDTGRAYHHTLGQADPPEARTADIRIRRVINTGPELINGATAARFTGTGEPTLSACMSTPSTAWTSKLQDWQGGDKDRAWCIKTNAGRYGLAVPKVTSGVWFGPTKDFGAISYLLWRPQPDLATATATATPVPEAKNNRC